MNILKKFLDVVDNIDLVVFLLCLGTSMCVSLVCFIGFSKISPNAGQAVGIGVVLPAVLVITYFVGPHAGQGACRLHERMDERIWGFAGLA